MDLPARTDIADELGKPLTAKDVARILGVDPRTVRKYAVELGGVLIAGRLRFFEKRIRSSIDASTLQSQGHPTLEGRS